jgi:hypothetical protein
METYPANNKKEQPLDYPTAETGESIGPIADNDADYYEYPRYPQRQVAPDTGPETFRRESVYTD